MSDLKPCPFCGGYHVTNEGVTNKSIHCVDCGAYGPEPAYDTNETDVDWNTRAVPEVKALKWTPWPDNKVDYLYQNCKTDNPFFDGHIILKGEIYELHIGDEYHNSYLSLEEAKDAAQAFFNDEILDQIEV